MAVEVIDERDGHVAEVVGILEQYSMRRLLNCVVVKGQTSVALPIDCSLPPFVLTRPCSVDAEERLVRIQVISWEMDRALPLAQVKLLTVMHDSLCRCIVMCR